MKNYYKKDSFYEDKPFNFAQLLLERINGLFENANESAVNNDPLRWYRVLGSLKRSISFITEIKTKDETLIKNKEILGLLNQKLKELRGKIRQAVNTRSEIFYYEVEQDLDMLETYIVKVMYDNGLYYPHYNKKPWEEVAEEEPT